jgi:hypothetical protein
MDATKVQVVDKECIDTPDNDAQLRATEQATKILERAGSIPTISPNAPASNTVNVTYNRITLTTTGGSDNIQLPPMDVMLSK